MLGAERRPVRVLLHRMCCLMLLVMLGRKKKGSSSQHRPRLGSSVPSALAYAGQPSNNKPPPLAQSLLPSPLLQSPPPTLSPASACFCPSIIRFTISPRPRPRPSSLEQQDATSISLHAPRSTLHAPRSTRALCQR